MVISKLLRYFKLSRRPSLPGQSSANRGFTLVEILIVVVILGVIVAISLPSYRDYILRTHRVEAQSALVTIAQRMEQFYSANFTYTNDLVTLGFDSDPFITENGYYSVRVRDNGGGGGACPIGNCFELEASAINEQAADTDCVLFDLNSSGDQAAYDDSNNKNDNC